jgi:hypothetical protein
MHNPSDYLKNYASRAAIVEIWILLVHGIATCSRTAHFTRSLFAAAARGGTAVPHSGQRLGDVAS